MPEHALSLLVTLNSGLTMIGIVGTIIGVWAITRHLSLATRDISQEVREVAMMQREVAFMIRRQYPDIDRDLREIKDLLGGQ
jgi:hypothetical protein